MSSVSPQKQSKPATKSSSKKNLPAGVTGEGLVAAYKNMLLSRLLDDKMLVMLKQGKSYFHIGCMGHEAVQTATTMALERGRDWTYPYYRDQSLCLGMG